METREQLDEWRAEALANFKDHRIVDAAWVDCWIWFWSHLYADLADYDAVFRGVTFRQDDDYTLMVLKVYQNNLPGVVFVSGSSATSCVRKLRLKMRSGEVRVVADKYV